VDRGQAALGEMKRAAAAGEPYPLVIIDSVMPEMDGFALAEQIRAQPELVGATIMLLVPAERQDATARCKEVGINASVLKPVKQSELLNTILEVLHAAAPASAAPAPRPPEPAAAEGPAGRPLRVLLAEDNLVNQRLAVRILEKRGHRVTVANNGKEALAALGEGAFDLVLMDLEMPELGGFEATEQLRARERSTGRHMPVIALTAHAMKGDRERCLAAGMDGYVSKPIRAAELFAAMEEVLAPAAREPAGSADGSGGQIRGAEGVLDFKAALEHVAGDAQLLRELAGVFVGEAPQMMAAIRDAMAARDAPRLKRAVHTLKGAAGTFGARAAFEAALRLEKISGSGDLSEADAAWEALRQAVERLLPVLAGFEELRDDAALTR
jgi:CheY-like chemotaxis protein